MTNLHRILIISLLILIDISLSESTCTLPNGKSSECTRLHLCNTIWNYIKANGNSPATHAYVDDYQKCEEGRGFVCCPDLSSGPSPVAVSVTPTSHIVNQNRPSTTVNGVKIPLRNNLRELSKHPRFNLINKENCGISTKNRIIHGNITEIKDYPWVALLGYKDPFEENVSWKCGGSLISDRYVLTAGHCFLRSSELTTIRLGEHNLLTKEDCRESEDDPRDRDCADPVQDIEVESTIRHPDYSKNKFANDIALIRLKKPANIRANNVRTICLPTSEEIASKKTSSEKFIIAGWGNTEFGRGSNVLLEAFVPFVPNAECQQRFTRANKNVDVYDSILCAGGTQDNVDTCNGDSGGPIMRPGNINARSRYVQFGVVSAGIECNVIDKPVYFPGVYTDLTYYMEWILDNMEP